MTVLHALPHGQGAGWGLLLSTPTPLLFSWLQHAPVPPGDGFQRSCVRQAKKHRPWTEMLRIENTSAIIPFYWRLIITPVPFKIDCGNGHKWCTWVHFSSSLDVGWFFLFAVTHKTGGDWGCHSWVGTSRVALSDRKMDRWIDSNKTFCFAEGAKMFHIFVLCVMSIVRGFQAKSKKK